MACTAVSCKTASPAMAIALSPSSFCAEAVLSSSFPTTTTLAPACRKATAADKPMPLVPPMITIFLSDSVARSMQCLSTLVIKYKCRCVQEPCISTLLNPAGIFPEVTYVPELGLKIKESFNFSLNLSFRLIVQSDASTDNYLVTCQHGDHESVTTAGCDH